MTRFKITSDDRREIDRARDVISKAYVIREEKRPPLENEKQRFRLYLFGVPKVENQILFDEKPVRNGDRKPWKSPKK